MEMDNTTSTPDLSPSKKSLFNFYPNPAVDFATLENLSGQAVIIRLVDSSGRLIWETTSRQVQTSIDLKNLAKGGYFIQVFTKDKAFIFKEELIIL